MAEKEEAEPEEARPAMDEGLRKLVRSYMGVGLGVFLALAPRAAAAEELRHAEEQVRQMRWRRREDAKANARVVEIFAGHRNAWQADEKWLLSQIDAANQEIARLSADVADLRAAADDSARRVAQLEADLADRDQVIAFLSRSADDDDDEDEAGDHPVVNGHDDRDDHGGDCIDGGDYDDDDEASQEQQRRRSEGFDSEFLASSASKILWQDVQYDSVESMYDMKHFVARRESPWKVDGESTGVSTKLKLLEQELINLEKVGKSDLLKAPSLMRKQAKRYQALAGKIDDLCRRMQASDPCEATLTLDFRTQRQTEFLLEAFRLQQRASETAQKLTVLQTEIGKSYCGDEMGSFANFTTKRALDSIANNFKEIQRNLEIWLARIIGDLEGILARDGASRVREYYISRYPFVQ